MRKEKETLASISHKNIIKFVAFFESPESNCRVLVTEYFESVELSEFISKTEICSEQSQNIITQIVEGMNFLHDKNIIHRDFNIKNILVNPLTLKIKIIDFGLSTISENIENSIETPQGNFQYRAPSEMGERWQNGFSIDVWCLCLVTLSLLMNKPISSKKALELLERRNGLNFSNLQEERRINDILNFMEGDGFTVNLSFFSSYDLFSHV